ncbi:MAG: hypothetical protein QOG91_309 [Candidatus Parcubacteria bacterium]|jgi:hypothetical protein|nr:hypothetical protein [Candidatus Parcubacteria bacterium]
MRYTYTMNQPINITKSDGTTEPFEKEKLISSLKRAGAAPEIVEDVVEDVEKEIREGITTADVYVRARSLLREHSLPIAVKYSIRRAMMELGPDGFPFEKFMARIFKTWGYETLTDQTVMGSCVDHEVDVVAWKDDGLAMVEAKYHNEYGTKSDVKVALYVKARFDDIALARLHYGGKDRKLTERWLATNTKFSAKAILYGSCNGLKLLGWNYPAEGNLHQTIERNGLHPITCMTSLSKLQKRDLVGRGALACIDIVGQPALLKDIGSKPEESEKILTEAQIIIEQAK